MLNLSTLKSPLIRTAIAMTITTMLLSSNLLPPAHAAAGDLDNTFGGTGKVTTNFQFGEQAFAVAIQADGKIIAAGVAGDLLPSNFALVRYNTDGTLDTSFGIGGRVTTGFDSGSFAAELVIAPDGKIIAVGIASGSNSSGDFALVRYNTDGSLDAGFGSDGKVTTDFFGSDDIGVAVAIQSDGRIVVGGRAADSFPFRIGFALARYNADGTLDPSFGSGGKLTTDFFGNNDFLSDLALQSDGKVVVTGTVNDSKNHGAALARFNSDGGLDQSFGSGGKVVTFTGGGASAIGIQTNGKIVVAGAGPGIGDGDGGDFALLRYNTDGTLDPNFGSGGIVTTDILGSTDSASSLAIYPSGKIVVGGNSLHPIENRDFSLARYNADGSLDAGFGSGGVVATDFSGDNDTDMLNDIAIQSDGKIVAAGSAGIRNGDFALARYNGDGASFNTCLQDDSSGSVLQINTNTGEYLFRTCGGFTISGTGSLTSRGSTITLQHTTSDRRVMAKLDGSINKATASIQILSQGLSFTITDRNTADNTCSCR